MERNNKLIKTGGPHMGKWWLMWLTTPREVKEEILTKIAAIDEEDLRPIKPKKENEGSQIVYKSNENS